ncbi:DUF4365 domain-containing protein [Enhygromyxa salina]|uniref:DUF4365 domain-containing protein n=1 Tax=Enhygromyxa salina TaxID=215803 RepID=UPI0013FD0BDD|nr:DUF4365 domain-containing protein [Enhygromyxa salina]
MPKQSLSQQIGSRGHRWVMSQISEHGSWIARDLTEDFGVDAEAELAEPCDSRGNRELKGDILKLQFKVEHKDGYVKVKVESKHLRYAKSCRCPVVLVCVDLVMMQAWYLWLQRWGLHFRHSRTQDSSVVWLAHDQTLSSGLRGELRNIAVGRNETQLVLSLLDAMRSASALNLECAAADIVTVLAQRIPTISDRGLVNLVVQAAADLGCKLRGTIRGDAVAKQMFLALLEFLWVAGDPTSAAKGTETAAGGDLSRKEARTAYRGDNEGVLSTQHRSRSHARHQSTPNHYRSPRHDRHRRRI